MGTSILLNSTGPTPPKRPTLHKVKHNPGEFYGLHGWQHSTSLFLGDPSLTTTAPTYVSWPKAVLASEVGKGKKKHVHQRNQAKWRNDSNKCCLKTEKLVTCAFCEHDRKYILEHFPRQWCDDLNCSFSSASLCARSWITRRCCFDEIKHS